MNLMHNRYKHHVVQLIMENIIIITIEKVTSYSETNNVPYHKNQLCTIPYTPMMCHTLNTKEIPYHITNDVPYHVPILKPSVNQPHGRGITYNRWMKPTSRHRGKNPEYQTVGVKPTSRHRGKNPEYQTVGVKPTSHHRGKNPEYQTIGSNRPHGNVATNKPSGQTDLTAT